jgi:phosphotransferase system HPr-like phosphotransfer protein
MINPVNVKGELLLNCFIGSARMCALIVMAASRFRSKGTISRGDETWEAENLMNLMLTLDTGVNAHGLPSPAVSLSAAGPDALEAVQEMMKLFPPDGGPERCAVQGCHSPAVLRGPNGVGGFWYRCSAKKENHEWHLGPTP